MCRGGITDWVGPRVTREAHQQQREQTPTLSMGESLGDPKDLAVAWGFR